MNISTMRETAYEQYSIRHVTNEDKTAVIARFAEEELKLIGEEVVNFIALTLELDDYWDSEEMDRFYGWYFINYLNPLPTQPWDTIIHPRDPGDFTAITIDPMKTITEDGEVHSFACPPEEAEVWAIHLHTPTGGRVGIADCKDLPAAQTLFNLLDKLKNK